MTKPTAFQRYCDEFAEGRYRPDQGRNGPRGRSLGNPASTGSR